MPAGTGAIIVQGDATSRKLGSPACSRVLLIPDQFPSLTTQRESEALRVFEACWESFKLESNACYAVHKGELQEWRAAAAEG